MRSGITSWTIRKGNGEEYIKNIEEEEDEEVEEEERRMTWKGGFTVGEKLGRKVRHSKKRETGRT